MESLFKQEKEKLMQELARFWSICKQHNDELRIKKVHKLAYKLYQEELIVAFCGHFSAGKSAMINTLMGEAILPSSPIPTSANLVAIHVGQKRKNIRVTLADEQVIELLPPLDQSVVGELGREGLKIKKIDLYRSRSLVPDGVTVLDTPGIDSVDDAHKQSTESAIHLADLIFYVMDYNHVQSQMNFEYVRNLIQHNRPVHAIINQIDKHREEELAFAVFKQSTEQAFAAWNATPQSFQYTSLKKMDHPFNEVENIQSYVKSMMENRKNIIIETTKSSLNMLKHEHQQYLEEELSDMLDTYEDLLSADELLNREKVFAEEDSMKNLQQSHSAEEWIRAFDESSSKMIKAAYLMPAEVRDKAKLFLESNQPSFKVGLLFSAKKTEEERFRRTNNFVDSLQEIVTQQLEWHMKNSCYESVKEAGAAGQSWSEEIEKLSVPVTEEFVQSHIKKGAEVSGESLLNYCEDISKSLRSAAKRKMDAMKNILLNELEDEIEEYTFQSQSKWTNLNKKANALRNIELAEHRIESLKQRREIDSESIINNWQDEWVSNDNNTRKITCIEEIINNPHDKESAQKQAVESKPYSEKPQNEKEIIHNLSTAIGALENLNGFQRQRDYLTERINKIESKDFTIALFGAFSAGKSSFANALLGKKVLPVSPNPTTASINRIKPPTRENPDGTVRVHFKQPKDLLRDLELILEEFSLKPASLEDAYNMVAEALDKNIQGMNAKKSFLSAFWHGWPVYKEHLGHNLTVSQQEFEGYVANENQSCFVESIDYYLVSPLSAEGVTIVDTPGADSINARHTDVSFNYIRNADAILFVTYYNHAFARADREFLIQLGRVKESFEMDKMFFVVNAADLARDESEKKEVLSYIKEQLVSFGIRFPRIYGVSSLQAISSSERDVNESGIIPFNNSFQKFLKNDLQGVALQAAKTDTIAVVKRLESLIQTSKESEQLKAKRIENLTRADEVLSKQFTARIFDSLNVRFEQELDELLIYMEQRVFFRFSDFFKESFHPSLFYNQSNSKALQEAVALLLEMTGFDFAQELRVINHRMALFLEKQLKEQIQLEWESLEPLIPDAIKPPMQLNDLELLSFDPWFSDLEADYFKNELGLFKNTRNFFEKNEKRIMREALEKKIRREVSALMPVEKKRIMEWKNRQLSTEGEELYTKWRDDLAEQIDSQLKALQSFEAVDDWMAAYESIKNRSINL
ncbi:dynamin family protein [Jeotgalibacillus sp. S-D1]|uniref:dynamin family protein n=1 Tax=Jeotgalibacillus sp. S-D1 TaxID=2552189 RepID=UPI001404FA61|nr:dynamin family protein [Jeotgalibacillus sp. S-D1]